MTNIIQHHVFFLLALRTGLIFIAGNELMHIAHKKLYNFIIVFLIDLCIIYAVALLFDIHF